MGYDDKWLFSFPRSVVDQRIANGQGHYSGTPPKLHSSTHSRLTSITPAEQRKVPNKQSAAHFGGIRQFVATHAKQSPDQEIVNEFSGDIDQIAADVSRLQRAFEGKAVTVQSLRSFFDSMATTGKRLGDQLASEVASGLRNSYVSTNHRSD